MAPDPQSAWETATKKAKAAIGQFKGQLTRAEKYAKEQSDQVLIEEDAIQIRVELLLSGLQQYKKTVLDLQLLLEEDPDEFYDEDDVEERCLAVIASLRCILRQARPALPSTSTLSPAEAKDPVKMENPVTQRNRLPQLDIPCFDGRDIIHFKPFIDIFNAVIDSDTSLIPIQKLFYLRKYVKEEASLLIEGLPLVAESYLQAIKLLRDRYENKTILITHHVNMLLDFQPISRGTSIELRQLVSRARQQLGALKGLEQPVNKWDMLLIPILIRKLDSYTIRAYYAEKNNDNLPTVEDLLAFIERRAISFEETNLAGGKSVAAVARFKSTNVASIKPSVKSCLFCHSKDHKLFACQQFQSLSSQDRVQFVEKAELCKICLNSHSKKCIFHFKCSECKSREHNSLLHLDNGVCNLTNSSKPTVPNGMVLLPTIKVKFPASNGTYIIAKGLVDSGSQVSFITTDLITKLHVQTFDYNVNVTALGQQQKPVTKAVNLALHSMYDNYQCNALFSVVDNITTFLPQTKFDISDIAFPDSIKLANDEFNVPSEISFLISADIMFKILLPGKTELNGGRLMLLPTKFGHLVSGNIETNSYRCFSGQGSISPVVLHAVTEDRVDNLLQKFWEEQDITETNIKLSIKENYCEGEFSNTVQLINNRFQVALPLKVPIKDLTLGNSFSIALQRLNSLCKKFSKNPMLKTSYANFIHEILSLGHGRIIDLNKLNFPLNQCYFLPHHAVMKEDSATTKLRVVFDASAKTELNHSLNDVLEAGPVVQKDLFSILTLFRTYRFVGLCDIKQMYRQVLVDPSQTHLQLILWKEHVEDSLLCLQLLRVIYGIKSSSFIATRCLVELANRFGGHYPLAASALAHNTYVDDCLFGASTVEELKKVRDQLIELLKLGSFELHKWCANNQEMLSDIPKDKQHFDRVEIGSGELKLKALGLLLDLKSDSFVLCKPKGELPSIWTKRSVLSFIGTFFDPLGLAGPIVTKAKEFMQQIWQAKLDWDTPLTEKLLSNWNVFVLDLMNMEPIYVMRDTMICEANAVDLIGFCDASNIAYGCCLYIRSVHNNKVYVRLLCSKSRIAPLKAKLTVPKLELNAAFLLAKLYAKVGPILNKINFHRKLLFTDSQIVLCWLRNMPEKGPVYVQDRVRNTRALSTDCTWLHIAGVDNPADCLSRGLNPCELRDHKLWWLGPKDLSALDYIPCSTACEPVYVAEEASVSVNCNALEEVIPMSKYSSILKIQRIVGYILRFINNCRVKKEKRLFTRTLSPTEYRQAMLVIVKQVQGLHFAEEVKGLQNNKPIKGNLEKMHPFLDSVGCMRVGGRLEKANIPYSQKFPMVLPKNCHVTTLIVRNEHISLMHSGLKLTLSSLAQRYYIVSATGIVKNVISKCVRCFRFRADNAKQLMGTLPKDRVVQDKIFSKIGIDYCGPFNIKESSIRRSIITKGYICILVCFITKCVHIELVSDLTTECFLAAFKRFCARRGMPQTVYCDNASTFKGANNQLRQLYELHKSQLHVDTVVDYCSCRGIEFRFIPSYSPTFGGLWEAAVKSAKYHFKRVIGNLLLTYEQFNTIIIQIEGILNSRPITPLSNDITDFSFLTPAHFLLSKPITAPPEPEITSSNVNCLRFWNKCKKIQQDFWRVWHKSYLSQLLCRPKWQKVNVNLKEGALVLLIGNNSPPLQWPVARISKVFTGSDGHVRVVEVKTANACHRRAINKVAVLPIYDNSD